MNNEKLSAEVEEVRELLQVSLRELNSVHLDLPNSASLSEEGAVVTSAAQIMQDIKKQHHQVAAPFARFNAGVQARYKRLSPSEKTSFIKKLAAHGTTQKRIATLLGMTQSAVSQHLSKRNRNSASRIEGIVRIDALLSAGASSTVVCAMLNEQGIAVDAVSLEIFLKVYHQIANAEV